MLNGSNTDRKLRNIYEAIDEGNYKQALQLCNKTLKKQENLSIVKALKAVVLAKSNKENEALELCQEVRKVAPTDNETLQALTAVYRELGQHGEIVGIYETASKVQPNNEDFCIHWFMAMVRNNDYKGQQQAALKLHKNFKHDKYLFWAIMSLVLQAQNASSAEQGILYSLAERMMTKAVGEGRVVRTEEIYLYLLILRSQNKQAEALAILEGELGTKAMRDPEIKHIKVNLLLQNERWADAVEELNAALEDNFDDWRSYEAYLECLFRLSSIQDEALKSSSTITVKSVVDFFHLLQEKHPQARGPFLAELALEHRLHENDENKDQIYSLALSYFSRFGAKGCCFEDLRPYLKYLLRDLEISKKFLADLEKKIRDAGDEANETKNVQRRINMYKLERYLGMHSTLDKSASIALVNRIWEDYEKSLQIGTNLEETENRYGDDYVVVASHIIMDLYNLSSSSGDYKQASSVLFSGIIMLERALENSKYNFQFKLLLMRMYTHLGVYGKVVEIFKSLDIKHVQYDTLLHFATNHCFSLAQFDQVLALYTSSLTIYKSNEIETPEMLVRAYQLATFSKIEEFVEFRKRLDHSLQHALTTLGLMRLDVLKSSFSVKNTITFYHDRDLTNIKIDDATIDALSDNRDLKVMMNCNPAETPTTEELTRVGQQLDKFYIKIYSLIYHLLKSACSEGSNTESLLSELQAILLKDTAIKSLSARESLFMTLIAKLGSAVELAKKVAIDDKKISEFQLTIAESCILIDAQVKSLSSISISTLDTLNWQTLDSLVILLEIYDNGLVFVELINKALSSKAFKKSKESIQKDMMAHSRKLRDTFGSALKEARKLIQSFRQLVNSDMILKELQGRVDQSEFAFMANRENTPLLVTLFKTATNNWTKSIGNLEDEFAQRISRL